MSASPFYPQQAEQFTTELQQHNYQIEVGQQPSQDHLEIHDKYAPLFAPAVVKERLAQLTDKEQRYLADFAAHGYLVHCTQSIHDELSAAEADATVWWNDAALPYAQAQAQIVREATAAARHELAARLNAVMAQFNPLRVARWQHTYQAAHELGFANYVELCERLRCLELSALARQAAHFLEQTHTLFEQQLETRLHAFGLSRATATAADVWYVLHHLPGMNGFNSAATLTALQNTLRALGIESRPLAKLKLDLDANPHKASGAYCAPISVPNEVWLIGQPCETAEASHGLWHEAGHAAHYAHVDANLPFAFRALGDQAVTEAYAFLFEYLHHNPQWLRELIGLNASDAEQFIRDSLFHKLWLVRRYAAKLNYELIWHQHQPRDAANQYSAWLQRAGGVRVARSRFLEDVDEAFVAAQYLRAWIFEAHLRDYLQRVHGANWYARKSAGDFLKKLWRIGQRDSVEEMLARMAINDLSLETLSAEFQRKSEF